MATMPRPIAALAVMCLVVVLAACDPSVDDSPGPTLSIGPSDGSSTATPPGSSAPSGSSTPPAASDPPAVVTWTRLSPAGVVPVARSGHTWTVDPSGGLAYLYGGQAAGSIHGDLWEYDLAGDVWARVLVTGAAPPPRTGHAAAWIDDVGLVVIGGRDADGATVDDAWRFDPEAGAWQALTLSGDRPAARSDSCAVKSPDGRLWISHGLGAGGTALDDTWAYAPVDGAWASATPSGDAPLARAGHVCWWSDDGRLMLFGGQASAGQLADLWGLESPGASGSSWATVDPASAVGARSEATIARHVDQIVVYGGSGADGLAMADIGTFGPTGQSTEALVATGNGPVGRSRATLIDDPAAERMLLFGGVTATGPSDELWQVSLN